MKNYYLTFIFLSISFFSNGQETTSTEVGITEGQLSVSLTGGAIYTIPIETPPGINGVIPQISLSYNSQGSNNMAGLGWSISGISSITRIPTTKFHDNRVGAVELNTQDRFALDGQRLVVKTGTTGVYGGNKTIYETENFSNIKITSYGAHPGGATFGPAYFLVEYPDGSKAYYGNSTDSRGITEWAITYWENTQGVSISYTYLLANNIVNISSIKYGSLSTGAPINEIQFVYIPRRRLEESFVGGLPLVNNTIVSEIKVFSNGVGYRQYKLKHIDTSVNYNWLDTITEKSGDGLVSYNPTVFTYDKTEGPITYSANPAKLSLGTINSLNAATVSGDFDGDGNMDFLLYPTKTAEAKTKYWLFSGINSNNNQTIYNFGVEHKTGNFEDIFTVSFLNQDYKLAPQQGWTVIKTDDITNVTKFSTYTTNLYTSISPPHEKQHTFPKFKRQYFYSCDGVDPLRLIKTNEMNKAVPRILKEGNVEKNIPKSYISGDFNGDGLTDIVVIEKSVSYSIYTGCGTSTPQTYNGGRSYFVNLDRRITSDYVTYSGFLEITDNSIYKVGDFNGDGKSDIYVFDTGKIKVYGMDDNNRLILLFQTITSDANITLNMPILIGDYNGDGKTDFMIPKGIESKEWYRYLATGTEFKKVTKTYPHFFWANNSDKSHNYIITDYDKDGKSDLTVVSSSKYAPYVSSSLSVTCYVETIPGYITSMTSDYNSIPDVDALALPIFLPTTNRKNSKFEIAFINNNKIHFFNSQKDSGRDRLLKTITTGNGVKETISYQSLDPTYRTNYNQVYSSSILTEQYPNFDIVASPNFQIVWQLEKESTTVKKKKLFLYYGAVTNYEGLGFLGFRSTVHTNWHDDTQPVITNISKYDIELRSANTENYTVLGMHYPLVLPAGKQTPRTIIKENDYSVTGSDNLVATQKITLKPNTWIKSGSTFSAKINPDANISTNTPSDFITKSIMTYENVLLANKVFKLQNVNTKEYNGLENTNSETKTDYDIYNNPTKSTTTIKEGGNIVQTNIADISYESFSTPYIIGRPQSKTQTVTASGDSMNSKETYQYGSGSESNLLKVIQKWGNNTGAITETNSYDSFGNITTKTISAPGVTDRKTSFAYDPSGRFLKESTDIEGFKTEFIYNPNGTLKSKSKQTELGTWNNTLVTGYEYDSWFKKTTVTDYLGKTQTYAYTQQNGTTKITLTGNTDGSYSEEVFDELGRKIRTGIKDVQGNMSYKDYKYDIYDRNFSVSEPNIGNQLWNTTLYDAYGRPETITDFKGTVLTMKYDGLTTSITDNSTGQTKKSTKNAMGNVITMLETPIGGTVNYSYFANGNLKETNYNGNKITITQDGWGRKTSLTDPSAGTYTYNYNELGENIQETTPNGTTTYKLNDWGKPETKTIVGNNTNSSTQYIYTPDSKLLLKTIYTDTGDAGKTIITDYAYDSKKRLETTTETNGYGAIFTKKVEYDAWGRIDKETNTATLNGKSSSSSIQNEYKNGFAYKINEIKNGQKTKTLWETTEVNAQGQLTQATLGNGIAINNTYDSYGYITNTKHILGTATIMELRTNFNTQRGNLNWRKNSLFGNVTENFKYDTQDRLTTYPNAEGIEETQYYEEDGRIKSNTLGVYNYGNAGKKYQNTSITLTPETLPYYQSKPKQTVSYNTFKSPVEIAEEGIDKISFVYNDQNNRSVMFYGGLGLKQTRTYLKHYSADGTMEIKENTQTGAVEFVTYIGGNGYSASVVYKKTDNNAGVTQEQTLYLHRDYQGSILAITNEVGAILEKRHFDAWGAITKVQDGIGNILNGLTILDRGYTGHEHLQSVSLIHMNGRLYDPKLHRFLQPDNYVQDSNNTQNYNRYGYVLNNPLKYTDPSGELSFKSIGKWISKNANDVIAGVAIVAGIALTVFSSGTLASVGYGLIGTGVAHFGATYQKYKETGDWNAASKSAGIFFGVSFSTDFGYNNSNDKASGVAQNEPVVKPITVDDNQTPMNNWELSEKAFGKANEIGTSISIIEAGLQAAGTSSPYMKTIGKTAGNFATFSQISDNSIKFYKGEENGGISLQLYSYRMIGTGTSWAAGSAIASWGIGGAYAGPLGILAGVTVGAGFQGLEETYNVMAPQMQASFNHFFNSLNRGNFVKY